MLKIYIGNDKKIIGNIIRKCVMRHYEVVFLVHPDYGDQIINVINRYTETIISCGGKIHRMENWGCRQLAYTIKKVNQAYYVLLNIEVTQDIINKLSDNFKFDEIILRNIIIRMKNAIIAPSPMVDKKEDDKDYNNVELYQKN